MTGFNHGLTGALLAITVKKPELAIPIAFISHFVTDLVPHFHNMAGANEEYLFKRRFNIFTACDFLLAVALMVVLAILFPHQKWIIWACMIAAAIPDSASAYYRLYGEFIKKSKPKYDPLYRLHMKIQWSQTGKGAIIEFLWFIVVGAIILSLR